MKLQSLQLRNSLLLLGVILALPAVRAAAQDKPEGTARSVANQSKAQPGLKPLARAKEDLERVQEGPEFLRRRQDWFFQPRAFPIGFIPQGARERALQQKKEMYQREGRLNLLATPGVSGLVTPPAGISSAWFPIGPQPTSTTLFDFSLNGGATSGRVTALVVNPNNASNVYLGGADGGLWVSMDAGATWTSLTDNPANSGIPTIAVGSLAIDPTTCGAVPSGICTTVYVGTGEGNFGGENIYGEGVLKCTVTAGPPASAVCTQDNTFHLTNGAPLSSIRGGPFIGALAVNPAAKNILLAAVQGLGGSSIPSGIWCSQDSGVNWAHVLPTSASASDPGTDVAFASDGTAWVALGNRFGDATNNGIYTSAAAVSSCTITFTKQPLPAALSTNIGRITLAIFPSATSTGSNATIYAAIADSSTTSSNLLGVAKTTNGGAAWIQLNSDPRLSTSGVCDGQCFYDIPLAVSPASANDVFFGGAAVNGTLIRSLDGGTTWVEISQNDVANATNTIHLDMHAIAFDKIGATMYVGNDGGVWKTTTPTAAPSASFWTNLNGNIQITQFYPGVSIHPSSTGFAMGGTQDNGIQDYQGFAGTPVVWQDAGIGCDGGFTAIDFSIPSTTYGECEYFPNLILIIATSFNNGDLINGFLATTGINGADRGAFIPPLVIDPNNSNALYFGTCRVYKTTDNAQNWAAISPDVTSSAHAADCSSQSGGTLSTIAIATGTSNTIYAGSDDGDVEVTKDGGTTWTSIAANGGTLPVRAVTQIVVDPSSATGDIAYVTFSGFGTCNNTGIMCDGKGHVFKTLNGTAGAATVWTDVSGTMTKLPDIPVNALVIDPDDSTHNTLYVGTDIGVFFTSDGGLTWSGVGSLNSLPNSQVLSLTLHNPSRTLRAATHGRGVWDLNLGAGPNTPALEIGKLAPFSVIAGIGATTVAVTGTGFISGTSTALFNGSPRSTTVTSATQLTVNLTAGDTGGSGVPAISVQNGTTTSNSLPFTVLGQFPTINSPVSPASLPLNSPTNTLTVTGTNFNSSSMVLMNPNVGGTVLTTGFVSPTQLTATIPASFMANFGSTNSVGVQNPLPAGGTTTSFSQVLPTFVVVASAPSNDNFASAMTVTLSASSAFTDTKDSSGATTETSDPTPACAQSVAGFISGRANTIWYKFTPASNGTITDVDTIGSSYDTVLSIWTGSAGSLAVVACNDDINPGIVIQSQIQNVSVTANTTYFIMVSSFGAADPNPLAFGGKSIFNLSFTAAAAALATTTSVTSSSTNIPSGGSVTLTATVATTSHGAGPTGTVQFMNGATALSTPATCTPTAGTTTATAFCTATLTTTLAFLAPPSVPNHLPKMRFQPAVFAALLLLILFLISLPRIPTRYRRGYACAGLLLFACIVAGLVGCGGNYGGGGGGGVHYDSITAVYSGDATYAGSTSSAITITIQ